MGQVAFLITIALCTNCGAQAAGDTNHNVRDPETLYTRLGGVSVLRQLVDAWLLEAASDSRIRDFFQGADISHLKLRLVERICVLVDGPCLYRGADVAEHHAGLGISAHHMRAFLDDLGPALGRMRVDEASAKELREALVVLGAQIEAGTRERQ